MTLLRWRYVWLTGWAAAWFVPVFRHSQHAHLVDEWDVFVYGGRVLLGLHPPAHDSGALHLYADFPGIQIGPPALLTAGFSSWITRAHSAAIAGGIIVVLGVACMYACERLSRARPAHVLVTGLIVLPVWSYGFARYLHLDDALALALVLAAAWVLRDRRSGIGTALLLGTAAATKPWAVVFIPLVLTLPRSQRVSVGGGAVLVATAWWAPFLCGDRETLSALGRFSIPVSDASVLHLFGLSGLAPHWVRPIQFLAGALLVALAAARGGLVEALLLGIVARLFLDPAWFLYYAAGATVISAAYDLAEKRWPVWTCGTVAVLVGGHVAVARGDPTALWCLATVVVVLLPQRAASETT